MYKVTVKIDGMMCGMCEAHICDAIRKVYPDAKKIKASRTRGEAAFLAEDSPDFDELAKAIADTGSTFVSADAGPYEKRGFFRVRRAK